MLNYIWLALIIIGVLVAVAYDVNDFWNDTYRNGQALEIAIALDRPPGETQSEIPCKVYVSRMRFEEFYSVTGISFNDSSTIPTYVGIDRAVETRRADTLVFHGTFKSTGSAAGLLQITVGEGAPQIWRRMAEGQGGGNSSILRGHAALGTLRQSGGTVGAQFVADPVKFVKLNKITAEGAIRHAKIAVEIALGLIGIMALWLGVMKIAEQSGIIKKIAQGLRPVLARLFPDVPVDHPAMGAVVMNIAANMLGLANAATPLGLKAMEELNKLNKKLGTATDAMCTFLVINTSNVQLIPATVIAVRAAAGSSNPTEILGAVIVATTISTVVGVVVVKLLARLPGYRKQLEVA